MNCAARSTGLQVCTAQSATNERLVAVFGNEFTKWASVAGDACSAAGTFVQNKAGDTMVAGLESTHQERSLVAAGASGSRGTMLLLPVGAACLELAFHVCED